MREVRPGWAGLTAVAVLLVAVLAPVLRPATADTAPTVSPIHAEFDENDRLTVYSVSVQNPPAGAAVSYEWTLTPPAADPGCGPFGTTDLDRSKAIWHHGDDDGCNHNVQVAQGHPGTVNVTIRMLPYICTGSYFGTITGDSPTPVTCVDQRPSPTPSPSHTYQTPSPDPSQKVIQQRIAVLQQQMQDDALRLKQLKDEDKALSHTFTKIGVGVGVVGGVVGAFSGPFGIPFVLVGGAFAWGADDLAKLGDDPPDPNYKIAVTLEPLTIPQAVPAGPLTPTLAADVNAVNAALNRFGADNNAVRHAWERANGAASANDAAWLQTHLQELSTYTAAAATDLDDLQAQLAKLQTDLQGVSGTSLTAAQLDGARANFPAGAPPGSIQAVQQIVGTDVAAAYGSAVKTTALDQPFPALLTPADLKAQGPAMSATLRDISTHTRAALASPQKSAAQPGPQIPLFVFVVIVAAIVAAAGAGFWVRRRARD